MEGNVIVFSFEWRRMLQSYVIVCPLEANILPCLSLKVEKKKLKCPKRLIVNVFGMALALFLVRKGYIVFCSEVKIYEDIG